MMFDKNWLKEINQGRKLAESKLVVNYLNGFAGTANANKNELTGWEVKSASANKI
jgi:hypothetical protein